MKENHTNNNISWTKNEPKKQHNYFDNAEYIFKEYICEGHSDVFGIDTAIALSNKKIICKTTSIMTNGNSLIEKLEPFVTSDLFYMVNHEKKIHFLHTKGQDDKALIELLNALDKITPIPYDIKHEIATDLQLDKEALGVGKKQQAMHTNKFARSIGQVNRQTNAKLSQGVIQHITSFLTPQDNLSPSEISRAVKHGSEKPTPDESKESFLKKVLDEYQDKKPQNFQERIEDEKKQPKKKGCTIF